MIWLDWVLCRLFNAKSFLYIYIKYMIFLAHFVNNIIKRAWADFFHTIKHFHAFVSNMNDYIYY